MLNIGLRESLTFLHHYSANEIDDVPRLHQMVAQNKKAEVEQNGGKDMSCSDKGRHEPLVELVHSF